MAIEVCSGGGGTLLQQRRKHRQWDGAFFQRGIVESGQLERSALALFYLDEFTHRELLSVTELKPPELAKLLGAGRRQFQAWLDSTLPASQT